MRVFLDTNVVVAAFISRGTCSQLFEECLDAHEILLSEQVFAEFSKTLLRKLKFTGSRVDEALVFLRSSCTAVPIPKDIPKVCRDESDNPIVAAAKAAEAHCLISGDPDLLELHPYQGMPILKPSDFWRFAASG